METAYRSSVVYNWLEKSGASCCTFYAIQYRWWILHTGTAWLNGRQRPRVTSSIVAAHSFVVTTSYHAPVTPLLCPVVSFYSAQLQSILLCEPPHWLLKAFGLPSVALSSSSSYHSLQSWLSTRSYHGYEPSFHKSSYQRHRLASLRNGQSPPPPWHRLNSRSRLRLHHCSRTRLKV